MFSERTSPLRERMIEDMRIRGLGDKSQQAHMTDTKVTPSVYNARITALRFFFSMTCGRDEMKKYMQFRTEPRKLPAVLSVEEVSDLLTVAPGPGLKYRAALSISDGAGLRASEVCNLTTGDIDNDRMLIHVVQGKGRKRVVVSAFNDAVGSNASPQPAHATMTFDGQFKTVIYHGLKLGELFDLNSDPGEFTNLWNDASYEDIEHR